MRRVLESPHFLAAVAVLIGYAPMLSPQIATLFHRGEIKALSPLANLAEPCERSKSSGDGTCRVQYRVPKKELGESWSGMSLGFGVVLRAVGVRCDDAIIYLKQFDDISYPGRDRSESNKFKVVQLDQFPQCKGDLIIEAWSRPDDARYGWLSGPTIYGNHARIREVADISDFYTNDLRLILCAFILTILLFSKIFESSLSSLYEKVGFELALPLYASANLINAGVINRIVPPLSNAFMLNAMNICLSLCAGLVSVLYSLDIDQRKRRSWTAALCVFFGIVSMSNLNSTLLGPLSLSISLFGIIGGFVQRNTAVVLLGLLGGMASLGVSGIHGMPHPYVHWIFTTLIILVEVTKKVSVTLRLAGMRFLALDEGGVTGITSIEASLRELSDALGDAKVSLFVCSPGEICRYYSFAGSGRHFVNKSFPDLPPVVAHTVTTRAALMHLSSGSQKFISIKGAPEQPGQYSGSLISSVPVFLGQRLLGVLTVTNYSIEFQRDRIMQSRFRTILELGKRALTELLLQMEGSLHKGITADAGKFTAEIYKAGDLDISIESWSHKALEPLLSSLDCSGFVAKIEPETRKLEILSISGYSEESVQAAHSTPFFAKEENQHGPAAVAANTGRVVVIEDINWLSQVVKMKTLHQFQRNKTRSCLVLPLVLRDVSGNERVWGLMWLESQKVSHFSVEQLPFYNILARTLSEALMRSVALRNLNKATVALGSFMPPAAVDKLQRGISPREVDRGFLMVVDLRGSTALSELIGADQYANEVRRLRALLDDRLGRDHFFLQDLIWDAFYFSRTAQNSGEVSVSTWIALVKDIESIARSWTRHLPCRTPPARLVEQPVRLCATFGDITRDLSGGHTNNWTIVGTAMATVSKLESGCKKLSGLFFVDDSIASSDPSFEKAGTEIEGTGQHVYTLNLALHFDKIA